MSLSIGLLQFIAINYLYASSRTVLNFDLLSLAFALLSTLVSTFILANLVFVVSEGPLMAMLKKYGDYKRRIGIEPKVDGDPKKFD